MAVDAVGDCLTTNTGPLAGGLDVVSFTATMAGNLGSGAFVDIFSGQATPLVNALQVAGRTLNVNLARQAPRSVFNRPTAATLAC